MFLTQFSFLPWKPSPAHALYKDPEIVYCHTCGNKLPRGAYWYKVSKRWNRYSAPQYFWVCSKECAEFCIFQEM
jgi:hypothetical protein